MLGYKRRDRFEQTVLPHLKAAYNLARWLTKDHHDAEDVVQEAYLRAFRFFDGFQGGDSRAWLLRIVRNTGHTWRQQNRPPEPVLSFDDERHDVESEALNPEAIVLRNIDAAQLREAMAALPIEFREALVLREIEELSYKEIAEITDIPLGTVMSRLARARKRLQQILTERRNEESQREL